MPSFEPIAVRMMRHPQTDEALHPELVEVGLASPTASPECIQTESSYLNKMEVCPEGQGLNELMGRYCI